MARPVTTPQERPLPAPIKPVATERPQPTMPREDRIVGVTAAPSPAAPPAPPRSIAAPLDSAALAARHEPTRAIEAPLTIVIDRIDVRVPVPPAAPAPRRERPRPSRTLGDYLGGRGAAS